MKNIFIAFFSFLFLSFTYPFIAKAVTCDDPRPSDQAALEEYIKDCAAKKEQYSGQAQTLAQALSILNTQIKLTEAKIVAQNVQINKLEIEINDLSGKIESLDYSLGDLTKLFVARVRENYMYQTKLSTLYIAQSTGLAGVLKGTEYVKQVRDHDHSLLIALEKSRLDFDTQKSAKETKQAEIVKLKESLDREKLALTAQVKSKNQLLAETKNSEAVYQKLLASAQAELIAIKGIIAGLGKEVKVKNVGEGERIASVIQGSSPCSTGTHLHFESAKDGSRKNPFELLKSTSLTWDNADSPQNGTGSWNWPLNDPIRVTQGYGKTSYSSRYTGDIHTGIDLVSDNNTVKAVKAGELYQGSMKCGSGNLIYVHVKHDSGYDTYYLHVNY